MVLGGRRGKAGSHNFIDWNEQDQDLTEPEEVRVFFFGGGVDWGMGVGAALGTKRGGEVVGRGNGEKEKKIGRPHDLYEKGGMI